MTENNTISTQDRFLASKDLVSLLSDYTALIDRQIEDTRLLMTNTVTTVMKEIEKITAAADGKTSGGMSGEAREMLFTMMGALSADDVITQRLRHVSASIQALKVGLSYVLVDFDARFSTREVTRLKKDLLRVTYTHYSTNEERKLFEQMFGKIEFK